MKDITITAKILSLITAVSVLASCGSANADIIEETSSANNISAAEAFDSVNLMNNQVDIDLTQLSSSMIYAQVYDMVYKADEYTGKTVKVRGPFGYFRDANTGNEYFSVNVSDISACCSQTVEFVLKDERS